ncbi:pirin family protein [Pseudoroseicyclus sp. CXY001]|uniref:pirin family protein n=1 Tax=Pseudoroseicyclus sp. CXY001 TaxID=3242492 RepID=UPI00358DCA2E
MSWNPNAATHVAPEAIEAVIIPRSRDIGAFEVRRALPSHQRQMVGPFIFFDQAGPAEFLTGQGVDVRPHPHIGLGTVTYLYQGDFHHRDSIGSDQLIRPGEVNWMVAGRGVTHSERTSLAARQGPNALFGIQTWIALPEDREEVDPVFEHHGEGALPLLEAEGITARLLLGNAHGERAPATLYSEAFYLDVTLAPGAAYPLPDEHEDRGLYITQGEITVAGETYAAGRMMVFRPGDAISVTAGPEGARLMALGGATLGQRRHIWWNFVSSSRDRIEAAKADWIAGRWGEGRFALPPGDDAEFVPAP